MGEVLKNESSEESLSWEPSERGNQRHRREYSERSEGNKRFKFQAQKKQGAPNFKGKGKMVKGSGSEPKANPLIECYSCGEFGHISRNCSVQKSSVMNEFPHITCYVCGEVGHYANKCMAAYPEAAVKK
ncbi:predicted protein, partial [Arabidopsis lyrata subsp. lyrata]